MHLERKSVGVLPKEEHHKQVIKSLFRAVLPCPVISLLFPHLFCPRTLPHLHAHLFLRWISAQRPAGGLMSPIMGWCLLLFDS